MSQHEAPMTPAHIWREMTAEQRLAAAAALWSDEDSMHQQAEAVHAIARQLHFRPQSVVKLAPEKLARHLAALRTVPESLASRALVVYHLTTQRPMLEAFLDTLGLPTRTASSPRAPRRRPRRRRCARPRPPCWRRSPRRTCASTCRRSRRRTPRRGARWVRSSAS